MPVTPDSPGPYAPTSAIMAIVTRHREKGLPPAVDSEVLARAGISESLVPRTLQALRTLDLIDEAGKPTDVLEGIRLAPEVEYKDCLKKWLTGAYADALQYVDPETATETELFDAFRGYKPTGQRNRMVALFTNLFRTAGVGPEKPAPSSRRARGGATKSKPRAASALVQKKRKGSLGGVTASLGASGLPPALAGLLASLPKQGESWTQDEHDVFLNTFQAVLSFCYPPKPDYTCDDDAEQEENEFAA